MTYNKRVICGALAMSAALVSPSSSALFAQGGTFDRTIPPTVGEAKPLTFPAIVERQLSNGILVAIMEDRSSPVVRVSTVLEISPEREPADQIGLSSLVRSMLTEGTTVHTADELSDEFARLGNTVSPFGFYTILENVDRSLELMAEQLLTPAFDQGALDRIKSNRIAEIKRAMENPSYLAGRVFANQLYGATHPYSRSETEATISSIDRDDIVSFFNTYYRPPNVKFVVGGAITPDEVVAKLEKFFGSWTPGSPGTVVPPEPVSPDSTVVYLYDRPNSPQSVIMIGSMGPRRDDPDYFAIDLMNRTLGGAFTSRLNLNLREVHQYTYGARTSFNYRNVPELSNFSASASVVASKTDSSLIEFMKEIRGIHGLQPVTEDELQFARNQAVAILPLQFETIIQRANAVASLYSRRLPLDFYNKLVGNYNAVTHEQVLNVARKWIDPDRMVVVIVGDRSQIEAQLRATGVAPVVVVESLEEQGSSSK